jgi:hypothetical protein
MNDTPPDVQQTLTALMMQRSEHDRARMAFEMFDLARALMTADILARHPNIRAVETRVQIFERPDGSDFDRADRARMVQAIRECPFAGRLVAPNRAGTWHRRAGHGSRRVDGPEAISLTTDASVAPRQAPGFPRPRKAREAGGNPSAVA